MDRDDGRALSDVPRPARTRRPCREHGLDRCVADEAERVETREKPSDRDQGDPDFLVIDDDDRYSRLRLISWWRQELLREATVLVVGAGALGNEVVKNLALVGLGTIHLIDLDLVEPSNLSRSVLFRSEDGGQPKAVVAARRPRVEPRDRDRPDAR